MTATAASLIGAPMCESLSVVVPNYNHAAFLPLALDGLLAQTLLPGEIIILDDQSTDGSWDVISRYQRQYPDLIRAVRNETTLGAIENTERGYHMTRGTLLYIHSADDYILPNCFETYVGLLERYPEAGLAASRVASFLDDPGQYLWESSRWKPAEGYYSPEQLASELRTRSFSTGQILYRKEMVEKAGGFVRELHGYLDWFWIQATLFRHGMAYTPLTLCLFRLTGEDSLGASTVNNKQRYRSVCETMLMRLHLPENADLLPFFARSGALYQLGVGMVDTVLADPRWWTPTDYALTQANFDEWNFQARQLRRGGHPTGSTAPLVGSSWRDKLEEVAMDCRRHGWKQIAVYGAGSHTRDLLQHWKCIPAAPTISLVLVTQPGAPSTLEGLPVAAVGEADLHDHQAILLSSHRFEAEMARTCLQFHPRKPVLRIYTDA